MGTVQRILNKATIGLRITAELYPSVCYASTVAIPRVDLVLG